MRPLCGDHRLRQAGNRSVQISQVKCGESPGPLRNRQDVELAKPRCLFRHFRAQGPGSTRFSIGEPESLECSRLELCVHADPMDAESGLWQYHAALGGCNT